MNKNLIFKIIKTYQKVISPFLGRNCRFWPSCSEYCLRAIKKHGTAKGLILAGWRVLRCNPWSKGGVDMP